MENLAVKMKEFLTEILEPLNIQYVLEETESLKKVKLPIDKRKEIYLVFKEAVNNAAKYSECEKIAVVLTTDGSQLVLSVTDDGKGFEMGGKTGNGLKNMQQRAMVMGGTLQITTCAAKGTTMLLSVPLSHDWGTVSKQKNI